MWQLYQYFAIYDVWSLIYENMTHNVVVDDDDDNRFTALWILSGLPRWARNRKVKPYGPYVYLHLAPDR